ncbi:MAG TPA: helix-turn-helix domain-containing protein [Thermoanaerobaculia bacterium]|nr:helix-turn-helix domain-containing protein [Thermoanaerobaculia bacterium]
MIEEALVRTGGNQSRAAKLLGITRNGLALKLKRLGITAERG